MGSLYGRTVLIVQRTWLIASSLAKAFEAKGAKVLTAKHSPSGLRLVNHAKLSVAVLDGSSRDLYRKLKAKGVPFILYTARIQTDDEGARVPIVRKPAPPAEVVARVEGLLTPGRL